MFQWGVCFSDGGASFLSEGGGGIPWGGISFGGEGVKENHKIGGTPHPPLWQTMSSMHTDREFSVINVWIFHFFPYSC